MQFTFYLKYLQAPPPIDGTFFAEYTKFLDLDLTENQQTLVIDLLTKGMSLYDSLSHYSTTDVMSNLRTFYDYENPGNAITAVGFKNPSDQQNILVNSAEYQLFAPVRDLVFQEFGIISLGERYITIDVEWYPESGVLLGVPMNWLEADELYQSASPMNS